MAHRRPVAVVTAVLLMLEGVGVAALNYALGTVVDRQSMSLAGLDPDMMSVSTWILGVLFGGYLAACGVIVLRVARRGRGPTGFARLLLVACAVTHGLLGALAVGLVGWTAFAFMMTALALIVLTLMAYAEEAEEVEGAGEAGRLAAG